MGPGGGLRGRLSRSRVLDGAPDSPTFPCTTHQDSSASDTTISGDGYRPRSLTPGERLALRRSVAALNRPYLRPHPFRGTCPTASDGIESIYRFRGFAPTLASCTYDLRGMQAVRLTERLLAKLRPR